MTVVMVCWVSGCWHNSSVKFKVGIDHFTAEHILYAHPAVVSHLTKLFNAIILHSHVPYSFGFSIIVPLVKDRCDDISKLANYRAISLSPVLAKLFESCLSNKFSAYMDTSDLQFGFKKHSGCANAIYIVQQLVPYYTKRGGTVYMSALDVSKAFDRIKTLIDKLISRNALCCLIYMLMIFCVCLRLVNLAVVSRTYMLAALCMLMTFCCCRHQ